MSLPPPLKVGIVTAYAPPHLGGIELVADSLFHIYRSAGWEVRWVSSQVSSHTPPREDGRIRVPCVNFTEDRLGVPWPVWGLTGIRELRSLARWADAIHVHDTLYLSSALAVLQSRVSRTPVLLSKHTGFGHYRWRILELIERLAYATWGHLVLRNASLIVSCTPGSKSLLSRKILGSFPPARDVPLGIDTDRFRPPMASERAEARQRFSLPESARVVLFVGRLVANKGIDIFVEVAAQTPETRFLIVGDGPLRSMVRDVSSNVSWVPALPHAQMHTAYWAAEALLLPAYGEGFPLAVLEAMSSGVPVVAVKGEPFADALERVGLCLCAPRNADAMATRIRRVFDSRVTTSEMAHRARFKAVDEWSLGSMGKRYIDLITDLVAARTDPA